MRILAISDIPNGVDPIVDSLNQEGVSIVAKEVDFDNDALISIISDYLSKKNFDMIVILPKDPIGVNMALNKHPSISAALCESEDDVYAASENNANTIILKRSSSRLYHVLKSMMAQGADRQEPQERKHDRKETEKQAKEPKKSISGMLGKHLSKLSAAKPAKGQRREEKEEDDMPEIKYTRKGIFGRLKDELGIVDEK